jgi:DNA-binding transcriptional LysR family regulator
MRWNDRIGRRIKLSDLHILMAVAQSDSMAKAASHLAVSHPVVSRSISDLERTLGVQLLERNPRGVELTDYGRAMLSRSNAAFDELRQGVKDIESLADPTVGEVRIGTTPPLSASFVSTVIERLGKRYPRIVFHVAIHGGEDQRAKLHERRTDLMIFRDPHAIDDELLKFESLFESPYVVVAGTKSPWTRRRRIELGDLVDEMWALPAPENPVGTFVENAFRAGGLALPRTTVVANALELRANLLRTGRYLSILPEFWLQFPVPHPFIRKLPVVLPAQSAPIGIFTLKNRMLNPATKLFIDCAREVAKPMTTRLR